MIKVYDKGRLCRIGQIFCGQDEVLEVWKGGKDGWKKKVWPDDTSRSNALRVKLPERGTEAWAYWVHAVDAVRELGASFDCYLYLEINGKMYYLIDSPDGSEAMQIEGNSIYFEGDADFPTDGVGLEVEVNARIPERWGAGRTIPSKFGSLYTLDEERYDKVGLTKEELPDWMKGMTDYDSRVVYGAWRVALPVIADTWFYGYCTKERKEQNPRYMFRVSGLSSGAMYCEGMRFYVGGRGDRSFTNYLEEVSYEGERDKFVSAGNVYHAPDVGFNLEMWAACTGGAPKCISLWVMFPEFWRTWVLEVESVNEVSL